MATKSISQLDSAVSLALGDLFEIAEPDTQSQTGYASKKISLSQEAAFIQENVQSQNLNTTNKTLVGAINEVDSEGVKWSENNVLGAKNLLNINGIDRTNQAITSVVNPDGTVTVNGTASAQGQGFYYNNFQILNVKEGDKLVLSLEVLSGSYTHGASASVTRLYLVKDNDTYQGKAIDLGASLTVGDKKEVTYTLDSSVFENGTCKFDGVILFFRAGDVFSNLKLGLMLRLESVKDNTFEPFTQTNRQLTTEKFDWNGQNVVGGKNLLIFPYTEVYDTELTVVYLPNGGVKVSCTNISAIRLIRLQTREQNTNLWIDPSKKYKISLVSDKKSASASECAVSLIYYNGSTNLQNAIAYANGTETIVNVPSTTPNLIECYLLIPKSTTLDNETFYPMIRNEEILDGTWMPYADTNHGLSINKADMMQIATVETSGTASKAYAIGEYMIWRNGFYKVTAAISQGGAITRNTNVSQTTIGAELTALFAALSS